MDCEQALTSLSAQLDSEIRSEDHAVLESHLNGCAECRATAESFRWQDGELRQAFAARRAAAASVADRVIAQVMSVECSEDTIHPPPLMPRPTQRRRLPWLPMISAAAAGFLVAVLVFQPWRRATELVVVTPPTADLPRTAIEPDPPKKETIFFTCANDPVECLARGKKGWKNLQTGEEISVGGRVRTGPGVRCEFRTADGSEIRLNGDTELVFVAGRRLELATGQILARVAKAPAPFQVAISDVTITALGTEFDVLCKPVETVLTVLEGSTKVAGKAEDQLVRSGEAATIINGVIDHKEQVRDLALATSWVHEILILKGRDNKELAKRLDDILAQIGQGKAEFMAENEIRSLGDHCVLPMTRYIESERSQSDEKKRHMAARILSDLAQPWSIPDLIKLLADDDKEVRYQAAKALRRLTSLTFSRSPEDWRDRPRKSNEEALRKWQSWWQDNKGRYPRVPAVHW
jgi:ferric-dicitrate binding protein FerR (iron transport regulator)